MAEYIERSDFKKILKEEMQILKDTPGKDDWDKGIMQGIKESIIHLNATPSADVAPVVHGKWRWTGSDKWNDCYECSKCGKISLDDSNFCPNCGAKMDGGAESAVD